MEHYAYYVDGFFEPVDFEFYKMSVDRAPNPAHFVEVGSWKGRSSSFMAVEIIRSGKQIKFDCVDTWLGSVELLSDNDVSNNRLYDVFLKNMLPVVEYYNPVRLDSVTASKIYNNESLDWVFIDASHDYENVLADINAWYPKVKKGGIISGHDFPHGPVRQAVTEKLKNPIQHGSCWYSTKQ
jgi:predicted O-methyltransferase YrrM